MAELCNAVEAGGTRERTVLRSGSVPMVLWCCCRIEWVRTTSSCITVGQGDEEL